MVNCWCYLAEGDCRGYVNGFSTVGAACFYARMYAHNSYGMPCTLPTFPSVHKKDVFY